MEGDEVESRRRRRRGTGREVKGRNEESERKEDQGGAAALAAEGNPVRCTGSFSWARRKILVRKKTGKRCLARRGHESDHMALPSSTYQDHSLTLI